MSGNRTAASHLQHGAIDTEAMLVVHAGPVSISTIDCVICAVLVVPAGSISSAAYALLEALFSPRHGNMEDMAAVLLPRLTPLMVGAAMPAAGKRSAAEVAAARAAAVTFVRGAYRCAGQSSNILQFVLDQLFVLLANQCVPANLLDASA